MEDQRKFEEQVRRLQGVRTPHAPALLRFVLAARTEER